MEEKMKFVYEAPKKKIVKNQDEIRFSSFSSYHLIILTARAKGEKQLGESATDDEDLTVQIDDKSFPKLGSDSSIDSPATFSGGRLHNFAKTVYFLTYLQGKDHKLILNADNPPGTATFEKLEIYSLDPTDKLTLEPKIQAEDGDRREWVAFVLDDISLKDISVTVTYSRRKGDSDDVKIKIDGQTQNNLIRDILHFLWYFAGSLLPQVSATRTESQTFTTNFSPKLHYIELDADRMPILENIILDFGSKLSTPKSTPTVDNPNWTGDFSDDRDEMLLARLIFGEAENQSKETKIWIAGSVLNRVKATAWPNTIHEVILQTDQYDPFKPEDPNYPKVIDPVNSVDERRINAWRQSYEVARGILSGEIENPTAATHFHGIGISKDRFIKQIVPNGRFIRQIDNTYFYWSPN